MLRLRAGGRWNVNACLASALIFACLGSAGCAADDDPAIWVKLDAEPAEGHSRESLWIVGRSNFHIYARTCGPLFELKQWSGTEWISLQDDRTPFEAGADYYLDGMFNKTMPNTACKEDACGRHAGFYPESFLTVGTLEYVQVGTKEAPGATTIEVPEIESRPLLSDRVQVTFFYYTDENCESPQLEVSTEVTFPEE